MPQTKIMDAAELTKMIGGIGKRRVALDTAIQVAAVQCALQSIVHRNITPAAQLVEAVNPHTKAAVIAWLEMFGNIAWLKLEKKLGFYEVKVHAKHKGAKYFAIDALLANDEKYVEEMISTPWAGAKKVSEPVSVYDMEQEFDKFMKRMDTVANKPGNEIKSKGLFDAMYKAYRAYQFQVFAAGNIGSEQADNIDKQAQLEVNSAAAGFVGQAPTAVPASAEAVKALAEKHKKAA